MTGDSYSAFNAMVDIFTAPGKALDEVREHTSWLWWPLLIVILLSAGLFVYYYSWVDFPWLVEETIRQVPAENRAESTGAIRKFMQPGTSAWTSVIAVVVVTFIIYTAQASYFHLVNKLITDADIGFGKWFSFVVWTSFVGVFGALAAFVAIFMADSNQMPTQGLRVFSLNALFLHLDPGEPLFTWASSLTLINFWTLFLMSIGYARWTGAEMVKSTVIAVLPWAVIFGVWGLMA